MPTDTRPDRLTKMTPHHIAMTCALEAQVGYLTAQRVLFHGKPIKSVATQRVALWARTNQFRIMQPTKGMNTPDGDKSGTDAALEAAERATAELEELAK